MITLRHILYLVYLCPCLGLGLLYQIYVIYFSFSASLSNNPIKTDAFVFEHYLEYLQLFLDDDLDEESE